MVKVLFTSTCRVRQPDGPDIVYMINTVHDLPQASADRWVIRDKATTDPILIARAEAALMPKPQPIKVSPKSEPPKAKSEPPKSEPAKAAETKSATPPPSSPDKDNQKDG